MREVKSDVNIYSIYGNVGMLYTCASLSLRVVLQPANAITL
ncbi:hypothetical protein KsCSTR_02210 [Candidatus Kuenenia stuttgartiensis]|uniref:Uncharacterized protein n=1 Tax=Kuenenia stuttgartiensis TaxID=174633 RepID=A0A6G7GJ02_KUEST|nr:hypothetical protein KsCSTR_02210 [Candidatus Kuenenia stuttgartiensis]